MCYRYSVPGPDQLMSRFSVSFPEKSSFTRQYHVSSFDLPRLPVITTEDTTQIQLLYWGLIPFWVKDKNTADELRLKTMNARAEGIDEKPAFRQLVGSKHCLVLVDGFFEWHEYRGKNYPYYIRLKNHTPFALAGLWDCWVDKTTNETLKTYTVITTQANPLLERIHNKKKRMPAIVRKTDEQRWISGRVQKKDMQSFFDSYVESEMEAYTISRRITSRTQTTNVPAVLQPFSYPELQSPNSQAHLF